MRKLDYIASITLQEYLDKTADQHNGKDYSCFLHYVELGLSNVKIAKHFSSDEDKVDRREVKEWKVLLAKSDTIQT